MPEINGPVVLNIQDTEINPEIRYKNIEGSGEFLVIDYAHPELKGSLFLRLKDLKARLPNTFHVAEDGTVSFSAKGFGVEYSLTVSHETFGKILERVKVELPGYTRESK